MPNQSDRQRRRELVHAFCQQPQPLIEAISRTFELPPHDPTRIRPYVPSSLDPGLLAMIGPTPLAWQVDLVEPRGARFGVLLDVVGQLGPARIHGWPLWRAHARVELGGPCWLAVCPIDASLVDEIRRAFDLEPAHLPVIVTPDAKVLDIPRRPSAPPPLTVHVRA